MKENVQTFRKATAWLNGQKKDFAEGVQILKEAVFKPAVVRKLERDGAEGPAAAQRLEFQLREFVKAFGSEKEIPDTDAEIHVFDGKEAPADTTQEMQMGIMQVAEEMESGKLQLEQQSQAKVIREYAAAYRQREKAMREMAEVGEKNDEESMTRRKALSDLIDEKTALMERLYPLFEKYQSGADLSVEEVENALKDNHDFSTDKSAATESGAAHTSEDAGHQHATDNLEGKSREELARMKKNAQVRLLRSQNKLTYQSEKKMDKENPMPEGAERTKLETRIQNIEAEIASLDMAIAKFG